MAYTVYLAGRWLTVGDHAGAVDHARTVASLERSLGVALERPLQRAFDRQLVEAVASYVYLAAQLVVVPAALVATYRMSRRVYRVLRDTVVATWLLAIPVYALFPVAPPRLAAAGVSDTVSHVSGVALTGRSTLFYNPYAAMPSLHVGFACAVGVGLAAVARRPGARLAALSWGPLVALVVVVTGNHYVLDLVAGIAVTAMGYGAGGLVRRLRTHLRRRPCRPRRRSPSVRARSAT